MDNEQTFMQNEEFKELSEFHLNLIKEKDELDKKCNELDAIIYQGGAKTDLELDQVQMVLLIIQHNAMLTYSQCLSQRLGFLQ